MQGMKLKGTLAEAFNANAMKAEGNDCWLWAGALSDSGYAMLGARRGSHVSLELDGRPRPGKALALHSCDTPACVNPSHLRWGTNAENVSDMIERRRHHAQKRDACVHGHPLTGDNLIERRNGQRGCRTCQRRFVSEYKKRRKEQKNG